MRRFKVLLFKELKELLTLQMMIPLIIGVVVFLFIGNIMGNETERAKEPKEIIVLDNDRSDYAQAVANSLTSANFIVKHYTNITTDQAVEEAKENDISVVVEIPEGFEKGLMELKPMQVKTYSIVRNFSLMGSMTTRIVREVLNAMNDYISNEFMKSNFSVEDPESLKNPIKTVDYTLIGDKQAEIDPEAVTGFIMSQTILIPILMFIVIMFAAQMIAVTVASEKENKTLETLLSTPISRISLVAAKMVAAGIASLLMAVVYMFGFQSYMNGVTGGALNQVASMGSKEAFKALGLSLNTTDYIMLGTSLFLSILTALALSLILGAFAEDVKKTQGLVAPLMFLILIPYLLTMFVDINSASPAVRTLVYIIPFSHPFLASPNLFLGNYETVLLGILYQAMLFSILVVIAGKIFSTDKILTMKLKWGRSSK